MVAIVTIEREYGSGGGDIAQRLAAQLGWKLWDQQLTEEIARIANCSREAVEHREERRDPLYYRLFKSFLRGSYEGSVGAQKLNLVDSETILKMTQKVIEHAAKRGQSVIVGRGSQYFLRDRPDALRIFLYADRDSKIARLMTKGKSQAEAEELVDHVDLDRADYIRKYFGVDWPARTTYHAMINTAIGEEAAVRAIVDFIAIMGGPEPPRSHA
jgi:cytidylate kinase